ncbi:MAG: CPBP family intramembrane metalloprotease [Candidatus Aegiribacteria sp.]|nr:CPBP family intramembrane metalloprotease [Candidatus Aegiribacteria sp.]
MKYGARFRLLAALLPFGSIATGIYLFHSAWCAILFYHSGILLILFINGQWDIRRGVFSGWNSFSGIGLSLLLFGNGLLFILLWPIISLQPDILSESLSNLGLSGISLWIFAAWYVTVHPFLEEVFWRKYLLSSSRRPALTDCAFAAYHVLVLLLFLRLRWVLVSFLALTLTAWLWRSLAVRYRGLAIPVVSHMAAGLSTFAAIFFLVNR